MNNYPKVLWKYRGLLYSLLLRGIKVRYKQTVIGIAWAVLQPLATMVVFTIVFSKFARVPTGNIPYPLFTYCALVPWPLFATSISFASQSVVSNEALIKKIYFPREILPTSAVLGALPDFAISFTILLIMMLFYKMPPNINILFVFVLLLVQIVFTLGLSFFLSAINVYYRDVQYALPMVVQLWMFLSPVAYPTTAVPEQFRFLYMLNPMAGIIQGYRDVLLNGVPPSLRYLGIAASLSIILFILCYLYFKRIEMTFADIV